MALKQVVLSFLALFLLNLPIWTQNEFGLVSWPFHPIRQVRPSTSPLEHHEKMKITLPVGSLFWSSKALPHRVGEGREHRRSNPTRRDGEGRRGGGATGGRACSRSMSEAKHSVPVGRRHPSRPHGPGRRHEHNELLTSSYSNS